LKIHFCIKFYADLYPCFSFQVFYTTLILLSTNIFTLALCATEICVLNIAFVPPATNVWFLRVANFVRLLPDEVYLIHIKVRKCFFACILLITVYWYIYAGEFIIIIIIIVVVVVVVIIIIIIVLQWPCMIYV